MSAQPWMKFYPRDWRGDQALRAISIAARGFWMECLCIMHEAKPYGHLTLNGEPIALTVLARMTGTAFEEAESLLAELRVAGVFSTTRGGAIVSRRMISDAARADKGRKSVEKRWSQDTEKAKETSGPISPPITQSPEARVQIPERKKRKKKPEGASAPDGPGPSQPLAAVVLTDFDLAVLAFNEGADKTNWPRVVGMPANRRKVIEARLKQFGLDGWRAGIARAVHSNFISGRAKRSAGHESWRASVDWLAKESVFVKLMEGGYDGRDGAPLLTGVESATAAAARWLAEREGNADG